MAVFRLVVLSVCTICLVTFGHAQNPSTAQVWLDSISYGIVSSGGSRSFEIHVVVNSTAKGAQYPCGSNSIALDDLVLEVDRYTTPLPTAPLNIAYLKGNPDQTTNSYVFHIPIGVNVPLMDRWQQFSFRFAAHCGPAATGSLSFLSPLITVKRNLNEEENRLSLLDLALWYRSANQKDTVKLTLQSTRPIKIVTAFIRDDQDNAHHNTISEMFSDNVESSGCQVTFAAFVEQVTPHHPYKLVVDGLEDGLPLHQEIPLTWSSPLYEYTVDGITNQGVLTVRDLPAGPLELDVQTNDTGTLEAVFDSLAPGPGGTKTVKEDATTANTRNHKVQLDLRGVKDGQYPFRFVGTRSGGVVMTGDQLHGSDTYILVVDTTVRLSGPIGLKLLQGKTLSFTYCLTRPDLQTQIAIHKTEDKSLVLTKPALPVRCDTDTTAVGYTAQAELSEFVSKLNSPNKATTDSVSQTSNPSDTSNKATIPIDQKTLPAITIHIHDGKGNDIASINLDTVQVTDNSSLVAAFQTLSNKDATPSDIQTAASALQGALKGSGLADDASKSLVDTLVDSLHKKGSGTAIATLLKAIFKRVATTYLGIPAAAK